LERCERSKHRDNHHTLVRFLSYSTGPEILTARLFTRVGTYVQRGSKFCFVVVVVVLVVVGESLIKILLYLPILFNITMLSSLLKILHYCPISPCIQQPCSAALPGSLARQRLPGSLARQPCPAALPGCSINFDRI
jgi:nucleoside permease NupC